MFLSLIGYRATGKTTVARLLAEALQIPAVDADVELEKRAGRTIASIFATEGEKGFRDLEEKILVDLCKQLELILAAGGGAVLRETNRLALRKAGKVVWLTADAETIHHRMMGDDTTADRRPNLTDKDPLEIRTLLEFRRPLYEQTADFSIDTTLHSPEEITRQILARL